MLADTRENIQSSGLQATFDLREQQKVVHRLIAVRHDKVNNQPRTWSGLFPAGWDGSHRWWAE
jgi:hypothetical protein